MKKTVCTILFLIGCVPFAIGNAMNDWMMAHADMKPNFILVSLVFLLTVMAVTFFANILIKNTKYVVVSLMAVPAVVLVLIGVQELVLHQYWSNTVGAATQLFYLPLLNLGFSLTPWAHIVFPAYLASFALMVFASWLGCKLQSYWNKK